MSLEIQRLSFAYGATRVLKEILFSVKEREIVTVLGPNGAGKSTLLKCIDRILPFDQGSVLLDGAELRSLSPIEVARRIGYVAQKNDASRLTAFDAILLGRYPCVRQATTQTNVLAVQSIITKLGMEALSLRYIDEMSGGELQKVCIARALVREPKVLLLDEPTSNLDLKNQVEIMTLIRTIADDHGVSAIMSLHDINTAIQYADRIVFMKAGCVYATCMSSDISEAMIEAVYGIRVRLHQGDECPIVVPILSARQERAGHARGD